MLSLMLENLIIPNVVYLISSLPSLTFGQSPPISLENFHNEAKEQLSSKKFEKLLKLDLKNINHETPRSLNRFIEAIEKLHTDFVEIRNAKANERSLKLTTLSKVMIEQNPLEREKSIMKWQWEQLTNIDVGETFTFTEVLVYKLKLQILHRLHSFQPEKGREILESVVEQAEISVQ